MKILRGYNYKDFISHFIEKLTASLGNQLVISSMFLQIAS